jgi:replicative superfamily II helicase
MEELSIPACKKIAQAINQTYGEGTATVHFSELSKDQKNENLEKFNNGEYKVICCSPTLLAGVNTKTVSIILDCSFFNPLTMEMDILPGTSIRQAIGRVGRVPNYKEGYVAYICQAGMQHDVRQAIDKPNIIEGALNHQLPSVLNVEIHLQPQSKEILKDWYVHTFSGYSLKGQSDELFNTVIQFLEQFGYIELRNNVYICTKKGSSVAKHFVNPVFFENCEKVLAEYPINSTESMMNMMETLFSSASSPVPWTEGKKKHMKSLFGFEWMMDKKTGNYDWNAPEPQVQWTQPTLFTMNGVLNVSKELGLVQLRDNAKIINYCMKHLVIPYPLIDVGLTLEEHGQSIHGSRYLLYLVLNHVETIDGQFTGPNEFKSPSVSEFNLYMDEFLGTRYNDYRLRYKFAAEGVKKLYKGESNGENSNVI